MSENLNDLEMAKKRDYKIMITDAAINKVPRVQYKEIPETEYDNLRELARQVLQISKDENDSNEVVAAGKVLEEQGLSGTITVIGWDDTDECLDFIRTGVVKGTIVQKPDFMGRKAVELLTRINNGEELTETVIDSGVTFVTAENVDTYKDAQ